MEKTLGLTVIYFHVFFHPFCLLLPQISSVKLFHLAKIFLEEDWQWAKPRNRWNQMKILQKAVLFKVSLTVINLSVTPTSWGNNTGFFGHTVHFLHDRKKFWNCSSTEKAGSSEVKYSRKITSGQTTSDWTPWQKIWVDFTQVTSVKIHTFPHQECITHPTLTFTYVGRLKLIEMHRLIQM